MHQAQRFRRVCAKLQASRYAKRKGGRQKDRDKRLLWAVGLLVVGAVMLYGGKLPLLYVPASGYVPLKELVLRENRKTGEEEVLSVRYANASGDFLSIHRAEGEVPEYVVPVSAVEKIDVRKVLEERFGDLEALPFQSFLANYYIEDSSTKATADIFDIEELLNVDLTVKKSDEPQILIFHTHTSEGYADSRPGVAEDTVQGAGEILATTLREQYGFNVIHETTVFDRTAEGADDRNNAYNNALPVITALLEKYPSIEVVIDLHRDSGNARTATVNGVQMAKVMLFNGLCRTKDGPISYYSNENLTGNLAFSLHLQITGNELFPGMMHRIYLKSYRYNMHLKEKYLLVELGTHKNTVAEAQAAMEPFAKVLATVLSAE
ncbi:MAG: stage II sporulation protein P [Lachnospiraceae bacterium]|nr:stage II sporulation protein P [Lachnospiraceae bacterium]